MNPILSHMTQNYHEDSSDSKKLKIRYFSDLHLEFLSIYEVELLIKKIPPSENEICILAGDIGIPYQQQYNIFMEFISKVFIKTFVISGNHEYYSKKTIRQTNEFLAEYYKKFDNISYLNNTFEYYQGYCFVGTILWSKITDPTYKINDTKCIPDFTYIEYNKLHASCVEFLENVLENNTNCIIITHHVPSFTLIDNKYKTKSMLPYNQWFNCDMDELIEKEKDRIKCWIYGHTHTPASNIINGIPFLCNPIGYPHENSKLDFNKNITL